MTSRESWPCRTFSLANPAGRDQDSLPRLLRELANEIDARASIDLGSVVFFKEINEDGERWHCNVYFYED